MSIKRYLVTSNGERLIVIFHEFDFKTSDLELEVSKSSIWKHTYICWDTPNEKTLRYFFASRKQILNHRVSLVRSTCRPCLFYRGWHRLSSHGHKRHQPLMWWIPSYQPKQSNALMILALPWRQARVIPSARQLWHALLQTRHRIPEPVSLPSPLKVL